MILLLPRSTFVYYTYAIFIDIHVKFLKKHSVVKRHFPGFLYEIDTFLDPLRQPSCTYTDISIHVYELRCKKYC